MEYIRDRNSNLPFSLHDSRIMQIEVHDDMLSLKIDRIFQYEKDEEQWHSGTVVFLSTDMDECDIMIFNVPFGYEDENSFSGKTISFKEFEELYPKAEFEIVTEGYCGYNTTYQGWIWQGENDPFFGIMRIWNTGDMIYRI